jgi:hypothetical protein
MQTADSSFQFGFIRTTARLSSACMILPLLFILRLADAVVLSKDAADALAPCWPLMSSSASAFTVSSVLLSHFSLHSFTSGTMP